ncbi:MAG: ABC transporter permease [Aggregatilineales bacterium]
MAESTIPPQIQLTAPRYRELRRLWQRARRSANVTVGGSILVVLILLAFLAPVISPYDPVEMAPANRLLPPNQQHLFGTDNFGRDILTRALYGAQISLQVGLLSVLLSSVIGTALGLVAGFFGGWSDIVIMRLIDVMLSFPSILLALVIISILGRSLPNVMIAVGISSIPLYTRLVRGSTLSVKQSDYVSAAQLIGSSARRQMVQHILPNILAPIIVVMTTSMAGAIISAAALSFLGLGAVPPTPEWGLMLSEGQDYLRTAWWLSFFPGVAIMITVLSINLLGDGLRDVLDPRLKL